MTKNPNIKMIRLLSGKDIICHLEDCDSYYLIEHPFEVLVQRTMKGLMGVSILPWTPTEILDTDKTKFTIQKSHTLFTMIPKTEFIDYYQKNSDSFFMRNVEFSAEFRENLRLLPNHME